jgi:hypothetical protein
MAKDKFKEQFPDYQIIPSKQAQWPGRLVNYGVYAAMIGVPGVMLYQFSKVQIPIPSMAGVNKFTLDTARRLAMSQVMEGRYVEAAKNFKFYFSSGGDDGAAMGAYAKALNELGLKEDADQWLEKSSVRLMEEQSQE